MPEEPRHSDLNAGSSRRSHAAAEPEDAPQPSREHPVPEGWSLRRGRDAYLRENGFTVAAYDAPWTEASILRIRFSVPNTPRHRWAILRHDLHHVATGYGTDLAGEGQISAWELRRGLRPLGWYVGSIVLLSALLGLVVAPLRTIRAWRCSGGGESLFHEDTSVAALLELTVGELRQRLGIPAAGLARRPRGLHSRAPTPETNPAPGQASTHERG